MSQPPPKFRYTVVKRGKRFWQPTPKMQQAGFLPLALGEDGPDAWKRSAELYADWKAHLTKADRPTAYPTGSFGAFFDRYRHTPRWKKKSPRAREDYDRAWKHIDAFRPGAGRQPLSREVLTRISTEDCETLADHLEATVSPSERYRTLKCLKALMADAWPRLGLSGSPPCAKLLNPQPKGRSQIWLGAEIEILWRTAETHGFYGMSTAIRMLWDTLFSPVDVRTLSSSQIRRDGTGLYVHRARTKTQAEAFGYLSPETEAALADYLASLPFELTPDTPVIRQRDGNAYRTKDTFAADFRDVRALAFPAAEGEPREVRQLLDIRRSGNVEADLAGADKATMGEILANTMATSRFLDETYTPRTVAKAREVAEQRRAGRAKLKGELNRLRMSRNG